MNETSNHDNNHETDSADTIANKSINDDLKHKATNNGAKVTKESNFKQFKELVKTVIIAVLVVGVIRCFLFAPFSIPSGSMIPNLLIGDNIIVNKFSYGYSRYSFIFSQPNFEGRLWYTPPKRGDVAVFRSTKPPYYYYVKRIIGLPGDSIQVKDSLLYINGQKVERIAKGTLAYQEAPNTQFITENLFEEFLPSQNQKIVKHDILQAPVMSYDQSNYFPDGELNVNNTPVYHVPDGYFFAMGDNRDHSADSRFVEAESPNYLGYIPIQHLIGKVNFIFFSFDHQHPIWEFWYWPFEIRWNRLLKTVQ